MTSEELRDKTTIEFRNPLTAGQLESILFETAEKEKCRVSYSSIMAIDYDPTLGKARRRREDLQRTNGSFSPRDIKEKGFVSVGFDLEIGYIEDKSRYIKLTFFTPPGYDLQEIPKKEIEFMEKVREHFEVKR